MMHFYSFVVGYALSNAVPYQKMALAGTGMALLWSLVLAGVSPTLESVQDYPPALKWLWNVSVPRWMIEAFYIKEIQALPFKEKNNPVGLGPYKWDNYGLCFSYSIWITITWHILALLALKLFNRSKQK